MAFIETQVQYRNGKLQSMGILHSSAQILNRVQDLSQHNLLG